MICAEKCNRHRCRHGAKQRETPRVCPPRLKPLHAHNVGKACREPTARTRYASKRKHTAGRKSQHFMCAIPQRGRDQEIGYEDHPRYKCEPTRPERSTYVLKMRLYQRFHANIERVLENALAYDGL